MTMMTTTDATVWLAVGTFDDHYIFAVFYKTLCVTTGTGTNQLSNHIATERHQPTIHRRPNKRIGKRVWQRMQKLLNVAGFLITTTRQL